MDEFIKKLKSLREKTREESSLRSFLPEEPIDPEEEKSESDLEITHYGRETQQEEGSEPFPREKPETEEGVISLDAPGFRELDLSGSGREEPKEMDERSRYIELISTLLEEGHFDQAIDEIRELKRLVMNPKG